MESAPPPVDRADQQRLLRWARQAIDVAVRGAPDQRIDEAELSDDLRAPRAAFVTLTEAGELRGCIGRLDPGRPLWESVVHAAVNAAIADPRFAPVELDELGRIRLEISVLDPPVEITDPAEFDPAVHGIIVERGPRRGLLLPEVGAQHGWSREQTLAAACWKADLPLDAWRDPETRLLVFTAFVFGEPAEPETEPRPSRSAECRLASRPAAGSVAGGGSTDASAAARNVPQSEADHLVGPQRPIGQLGDRGAMDALDERLIGQAPGVHARPARADRYATTAHPRSIRSRL